MYRVGDVLAGRKIKNLTIQYQYTNLYVGKEYQGYCACKSGGSVSDMVYSMYNINVLSLTINRD